MLDKKYNHKLVEEGKYKSWVDKKAFEAGDKSKEPFSIVIPPPNVTGNLHLGHALNGSIQDVIIRYKKMKGFDTLWLPGMDHAAIATEAKVVARVKSEGKDKYKLGREEFLKECWKWTDEHRDNIHRQWAKMGLTDKDLQRLQYQLLENPLGGAVMKGTGGLRKIRFAFEKQGKSGSARVVYVDFAVYEKIFLITAYPKNEKDNLSQAERNGIKKLIEALEDKLKGE